MWDGLGPCIQVGPDDEIIYPVLFFLLIIDFCDHLCLIYGFLDITDFRSLVKLHVLDQVPGIQN